MEKGIINGNPTKIFFIDMITRDISIKDAIIDLIDNSIDGAKSINKKDYSGLYIKITVNESEFVIEDNCGGFSLEVAKNYAFRFGRPEGAESTSSSISRFGVGMKRALFKMGKLFEVESKTDKDHFQVDVDVDEWKTKKMEGTEVEDWNFSYEKINQNNKNLKEKGTYIKVGKLNSQVSDLFKEDTFLNSLKGDIERFLNFSLEKSICIKLNGKKLSKKGIDIIHGDETKPYIFDKEKNGVKYRIIAGLSNTGNPSAAGWYIYCNDRLVLEGDSSELTGWGVGSNVKFHPDYAMFRGILFLDSDDPLKLPLTTTKKGIDSTSEAYKIARYFMDEAMKYVLNFLKEVRRTVDEPDNYRKVLYESQDKKSVVEMKSVEVASQKKFIPPSLNEDDVAIKSSFVTIAFKKEKELVDKTKVHNKAKSYKELGESIFDYYVKMEEIENE